MLLIVTLPCISELKESLILHVERRSLMVAGVVVAIGAAIMLLGCLWIHWCHTEHGEYVPLTPAKEEHEKKQQQHHHQKLRDHSHKAGTHLDNGVKKLTHRRVHVVTKSHWLCLHLLSYCWGKSQGTLTCWLLYYKNLYKTTVVCLYSLLKTSPPGELTWKGIVSMGS